MSAVAEFQIRRSEDGVYRRLALDTPPAELRPGEVLLRPQLIGICGSDLVAHTHRQNLGACFGHEWLGEVVAVGKGVRALRTGERATSGAFIGCGECPRCLAGATNHCARPEILGRGALGAARSWLVLPETELVSAPNFMGDAGILVEPASVAVEVIHALARIGARDPEVLVVGAGAIGLLTLMLLQERGARPTLIERCPQRMAAARELGVAIMDARDEDRLRALERSFPALVDCAHGRDGSAGGWSYVPRLLRRGGAVVAVAKYPSSLTLDVDALAGGGLTIAWLRGASHAALVEAVERWPRLLVDRHRWLVSDEFPVDRIDHALARALDTEKSRKVTLRMAS